MIEHESKTRQTAPMSMWDGFIYNFLAMGVIFPWVYMWGPAAFPGAHIAVAIFLTFLVQLPISVTYCFAAAAIRENGGDYVYQQRAFGRLGTIVVLSGFVIWILQWVAISGWLFTTLGVAPLMMSFSTSFNLAWLTRAAVITESPGGVIFLSCALSLSAVLLLRRGLYFFARMQRLLFVFTVLSVCTVALVFLRYGGDSNNLNNFVKTILSHLAINGPPAMSTNFQKFLQEDVHAYGFTPSGTFSLLATLGVIPIVWTGLQWATYSVEQNEDIAGSHVLRNQFVMLVGSAALVTVMLIIVAGPQVHAFGTEFLRAATAAYWLKRCSPETYVLVRSVLQPFPNVLAMASSGSPTLSFIIALGFMANAFQVTCNCYIGMSKIILRMDADGLFPKRLRLNETETGAHAPMRAYWLYFWLSFPIIIGYSVFSKWYDYTVGVIFAGGYVFLMSSMAIRKLACDQSFKEHCAYLGTNGVRNVRIIASVASILAATMVVCYLVIPQLGMRSLVADFVVVGIFIFCMIWVFWRSRMNERTKLLANQTSQAVQTLSVAEHTPETGRFAASS